MYVSINRFRLRISVSLRSLLWLSLGMALVMSSRMAVGQEPQAPAGAQTQFGDAVEDGWLFSDQLSGQSGEAFGALLRAGVLTGPAVGRDVSLIPIELMPYAFAGKGMFFGDIRGFRANSDQWGANLGGGFRYHSEQLDRIFGANVYYDYDNTSGALFRQVGFGLETLGALWDMRANAYFPTGVTEQLLAVNFVTGSERFAGHQILFDQRRTIGNALTGVDMEAATPLPGRVMQRHDVRVAGGWYHYQGQELNGFAGWKTRIQGNLLPSIQLQLEVTNDKIFNTNVVFGATWTYGGFRQPETERRTQFNRMTEPVRRNYNVIVAKTSVLDAGQVAFNPNTGAAYFVEHVASYAPIPGANGTVENPWRTVSQAQTDPAFAPSIAAAGGDIIFVHADSVYDAATLPVGSNAVTLTPSIRILGEGNNLAGNEVEHRINVANLGQIPLPRATAFVNRPIFTGAAANGVTLISGSAAVPSEFSGFQIGTSVGNGIFGNGVSNVLVTQTDVNFAGGDGVLLTNPTGSVIFRGTRVNNPTGSAFHVSGGTGGVTFADDSISGAQGLIDNSGGRALLVENTLVGSFVNLTGSTITDTAGQGILIDNANGTVTVDETTINDSLVTGIEVQGGGGRIDFRGGVTIDNPLGDAISIHNTLAASSVSFSQVAPGVTITDRNAHGINLLSNAGLVSFAGPVSITDTIGAAAAAVEYQNSSGNAQFLSTLTITDGGGEGIVIGGDVPLLDNSGRFIVRGNTTISSVALNGILITRDDAQVEFNGLTVASRGLSGINVNNSRGDVTFNLTTTIDNTLVSTSPAVDIQSNTTADVAFETLTITGATRPLPLVGGAGLNIINNLPSVFVNTLNVTTNNGIGLFVDNAGDSVAVPPTGGVSIGTGVIASVGSAAGLGRPAVDVQNSVIQLGFQSVSSTNSVSQGIILANNVGAGNGTLFNISGLNGVPLSGGTITTAIADGAFFQNTGGVSLTNMNILANGGSGVFAQTGVFAQATGLTLIGSQIQQNGQFGVDVLNTPAVTLLGNVINGNALNEVRFTAAAAAPIGNTYSFTLGGGFLADGNIINDATRDAVLIQTQGAGIGSPLSLLALNNTLTTTAATFDAFHLDWNGAVQGSVNLNTFNFGGNFRTGLFMNLGSATAASTVEILSNTFNAPAGVGTIGIDLTTNGGPANINIGRLFGQANGNVMNFATPVAFFSSDAGMQFNLAANTNINVSDNRITMVANGATGIEFTQVQGTSTITMNNNVISVDDGADNVVDEFGISILSATGSVTLFGTQNNDVQLYFLRNSVSPWFSAPGGVTGNIIVNGALVP